MCGMRALVSLQVQHSRMKGKQVTLAHAQQLFAQERETVLVSREIALGVAAISAVASQPMKRSYAATCVTIMASPTRGREEC